MLEYYRIFSLLDRLKYDNQTTLYMLTDLETRLFQPDEVRVTYIHKEDDIDYKNTRKWLEDMFSKGDGDKVSPIVVVADAERSQLYVFDGNKRVRRASEGHYPVPGILIKDKEDFERYRQISSGRWFDITDFDKLIGLMRMYAEHPHEDIMPAEMAAIIRPLVRARQEESYRELFPYDDDD